RRWLEQNGADWPTLSSAAERGPHLAALGNVRAALEWCFGAAGNVEVGVGLAAAAGPVFLATSLLPECNRWSERAILALGAAARGGPDEMSLQATLGMSLMFMSGGSEVARVALDRSLEIAVQRNDVLNQLRLLSRLHMFHTRIGDFRTALNYARRGATLVKSMKDPAGISLA